MPFVLVRRNMQHDRRVLTEMPTVLRGLTRGLDLSVLDPGYGEHGGHAISFYPRTAGARHRAAEQLARRALAVGPGDRAQDAARPEARQRRAVDAVPARSRRSSRPACPRDAFSYFPSDHAGAGEIVRRTGRSMFFGDVSAVGRVAKAIRASSCTARATARC